MQALEDLIVQTEIFLQYSLQAKRLERLQKIAAMFPGEEERNRGCAIFTSWRIGGRKVLPKRKRRALPHRQPAPVVHAEPAPESYRWRQTGVYTAETLRDLSKISEINQKIFRQQTPRAMLNTAVNEVGGYLARYARAGGGWRARPAAGACRGISARKD